MKLHELVEGVIYLGEDGKEYKHDRWHLMDCLTLTAVICYETLTQDFTPKKVRRIVELVEWHNIYSDGSKGRHPTKEQADAFGKGRIACVEMRGSYEEKE